MAQESQGCTVVVAAVAGTAVAVVAITDQVCVPLHWLRSQIWCVLACSPVNKYLHFMQHRGSTHLKYKGTRA
eukprot:1160518-Pelagomonas_calceolata.AAC.4